ncbi:MULTISPECIES: ADP-ribosylglycohydrolase family protein [unclassified Acinetobacter]|uniref:ADP-ribosylglycohydrolase family protein n=1 Tax=unclassified Acinetobacter TaxID=196816 RepID=UPI00287EE033|nr:MULTISPECIES: ADP-ribosylglycohydrolase family protein [unclassified Acinetobacter]MDS7958961.1 ADP-ribosylglycohydrolase family protein [Acinetobacter sp. V104_13]MDS7983090.1 ADP-ribosylglycohydrolase family protein [Acinetobacter sp. V104_3]
MLTEIAIADAYGAGFEFCSEDKIISLNNLELYSKHELYNILGKYTDDTQMSIAIVEFILSDKEWNKENIALKFIECFKRDVRLGYSEGFFNLLSKVESSTELLELIIPTSERNGAAMRSVPIGFLKKKEDVIALAKLQAQVTHDSPIGIQSSCAVALAAHFGTHQKGSIRDLESFLDSEQYGNWDYNWKDRVSLNAYDTVSAALTCLLKHSCLSELLKSCINLGGDTDSVAAIAVGLATCFIEYKKDLPIQLYNNLNEDKYGVSFLLDLESKFLKKCNLDN